MPYSFNLKTKLAQKGLTIGSWLSWGFSPMTEVMAKAGFEWLVIDMEHTAIDYAEAHQMIQTIELVGCVPLVRVGNNEPLIIKRVLDSGEQPLRLLSGREIEPRVHGDHHQVELLQHDGHNCRLRG